MWYDLIMRHKKKTRLSKTQTKSKAKTPKIKAGYAPSKSDLSVVPQLKAYFGYSFYKSAMRFRAQMDIALEKFGILTPHMGILRLIKDLGTKSQQDLGDLLGIDKASMVKFVDILEEKKIVIRTVDKADRRSKLVSLTTQGENMLAHLADVRKNVEEDFLSPLSAEEQKVLRIAMPKLLR